MEKAIMKILIAYVSRNETCFINDFEFIVKVHEEKYKIGTFEIDKMNTKFKGTYYVTLSNHGLQIEEIL